MEEPGNVPVERMFFQTAEEGVERGEIWNGYKHSLVRFGTLCSFVLTATVTP